MGNKLPTLQGFPNHEKNTEMRQVISCFFFLGMVFIQNCFATDTISICQHGDWIGKIGGSPVVMRFFDQAFLDDETITGKYYYQNHKAQELTLKRKQGLRNRWEEVDSLGKVTATLTLSCNMGILRELVGQWQSSDNSKTLPIQLEYIRDDIQDQEGYYELRLDAPQIVKTFQLGKHSYSMVAYPDTPDIQNIQLQGDSEGERSINRTLLKNLKRAVSSNLTCREISPKYGYEVTTKILMWEKDFVVTQEALKGDCGNTDDGGFDYETYNLADGALENLDDWFREEERFRSYNVSGIFKEDGSEESAEISEDDEINAFVSKPSLIGELVKHYLEQRKDTVADSVGDAKECLKEVTFSTKFARPSPDGMIFQAMPDRNLVRACKEEVLIPYSVVLPYLSDYGKARLSSISIK